MTREPHVTILKALEALMHVLVNTERLHRPRAPDDVLVQQSIVAHAQPNRPAFKKISHGILLDLQV